MKVLKKMFLSLLLLTITTATVIAANSNVEAAACPIDSWYTYSIARGEVWSGTILISYEQLAKNEKPNMPSYAAPIDVTGYIDVVVRMKFYLRLYARGGKDVITFSGAPGMDNDGYSDFWLIGDYCGRQGEALHNFFRTKVYPTLCGGECSGALKSVIDESGNTEFQAINGYDPTSPLHHSAEITIVAPCSNCAP